MGFENSMFFSRYHCRPVINRLKIIVTGLRPPGGSAFPGAIRAWKGAPTVFGIVLVRYVITYLHSLSLQAFPRWLMFTDV